MKIVLFVIVGLLFFPFSASLAKDLPKIAVWELVAREVKPTHAQELTSILASEISKLGKYEVYSQENVRTLAGWTAERMQLGCTDSKCLTALGQMDVAKLVSGSVGKIGSRYSVSLNLFDTQNARAEKLVSEFCRSEDELIDLVQMAVRKLLGEARAAIPEPVQAKKLHFNYDFKGGPFVRRMSGTIEDPQGLWTALAPLKPPPGARGGYGLIGDDNLLGKEPGYGLRQLGRVARRYLTFETFYFEQPSGWSSIGVQSGVFRKADELNDTSLGWAFFDLRDKFEADLKRFLKLAP